MLKFCLHQRCRSKSNTRHKKRGKYGARQQCSKKEGRVVAAAHGLIVGGAFLRIEALHGVLQSKLPQHNEKHGETRSSAQSCSSFIGSRCGRSAEHPSQSL